VVGMTVTVVAVVAGMRRYKLQKDVAGAPNAFTADRTPVTTLQSTARAMRTSPCSGRARTWVLP
jgi:hypothetical protein